jgi:hypothetical protein
MHHLVISLAISLCRSHMTQVSVEMANLIKIEAYVRILWPLFIKTSFGLLKAAQQQLHKAHTWDLNHPISFYANICLRRSLYEMMCITFIVILFPQLIQETEWSDDFTQSA